MCLIIIFHGCQYSTTHTWLAPIGYHKVVRLKSILLHKKDPDMDSLLDVCFSPAAHV